MTKQELRDLFEHQPSEEFSRNTAKTSEPQEPVPRISYWRDADILLAFLNLFLNGLLSFDWVRILGLCSIPLILIPIMEKQLYDRSREHPKMLGKWGVLFRLGHLAAMIIGCSHTIALLQAWTPF